MCGSRSSKWLAPALLGTLYECHPGRHGLSILLIAHSSATEQFRPNDYAKVWLVVTGMIMFPSGAVTPG